MKLEMTEQQFRRLLDLVYIGNWVVNSTRGDDRIEEFDEIENLVFSQCPHHGMAKLIQYYQGQIYPSRAYAEGGIHEAIMDYEDTIFFEILAEEFARRDMESEGLEAEGQELNDRIGEYIAEFEQHGTDNISIELE